MKRQNKHADEWDLTCRKSKTYPAIHDRAGTRKGIKVRLHRRDRRQFDWRDALNDD
jgi:hypothetical protein